MERNMRFLAVGICALLAVLFLFSANVLADQETIAGVRNVDYQVAQVVEDSGWGDSDESITEEEEGEETGEEFQGVPSDSDEEFTTDPDEESVPEAPSDEEDLPTTYQGEDE